MTEGTSDARPDGGAGALSEAKEAVGAEAMYAADKSGRIDLDHATPVTGSYEGVDGMGLFWSMDPINGDPDQSSFVPPLKDDKPTAEIQFSVRSGDKTLATSTLTRRWLTDSQPTWSRRAPVSWT